MGQSFLFRRPTQLIDIYISKKLLSDCTRICAGSLQIQRMLDIGYMQIEKNELEPK